MPYFFSRGSCRNATSVFRTYFRNIPFFFFFSVFGESISAIFSVHVLRVLCCTLKFLLYPRARQGAFIKEARAKWWRSTEGHRISMTQFSKSTVRTISYQGWSVNSGEVNGRDVKRPSNSNYLVEEWGIISYQMRQNVDDTRERDYFAKENWSAKLHH